ncbi:unnamed protein product [Effrenium voratum]|nr:unnamed protein product [Effrenium voratum]
MTCRLQREFGFSNFVGGRPDRVGEGGQGPWRQPAAFYSGLRGGQMLGEATVKISQKWGLTEKLPFALHRG